ncbi:MAG: hypothetical protein ACR2QW_07555 [bacterium]
MKRLHRFAVIVFALNLVACGGGGGSSDGAGAAGTSASNSNQNINPADLAKFAGTYTGTITATATVDGQSETLSREITFIISDDGTTITVEGEVFPLTSDAFSITVSLPLSSGNINCNFFDATFNGMISEGLISGNLSGDGDCLVDGKKISGQLSGYSGATLN